MSRPSMAQHAEQALVAELGFAEPEDLERMLIGDALVVREGNHYWIESGGDTWEELEVQAQQLARCHQERCSQP